MRGQVETTIPQRQYENLKITYFFEDTEERREAIELAISDCLEFHNKLCRSPIEPIPKTEKTQIQQALNIVEEKNIDGINWRKRIKGKRIWWEFWHKAEPGKGYWQVVPKGPTVPQNPVLEPQS